MIYDFNATKQWLRKEYPPKHKYTVRLVTKATIDKYRKHNNDYKHGDDGWDGYCCGYFIKPGKYEYIILINKELADWKKVYTLIHEHSHMLQFDEPFGDQETHGTIFNKYHKKLWRAFKKWTE